MIAYKSFVTELLVNALKDKGEQDHNMQRRVKLPFVGTCSFVFAANLGYIIGSSVVI